MSSEMRECPFCGNGAWVVRVPDTRRFRPQCKKCGADRGEFDREADAVAAWNNRALLARTEAGADGVVAWQFRRRGRTGAWLAWEPCTENLYDEIVEFREYRGRCAEARALHTHPQDASGDARPVLFGRDSGGDWYVDADTKSICVDVDFDPARQLSLILKQDGRVAWSIFVQEPDSSTTKATGPSVMNTGFYEALSYIAMQAKEAK